MNFAEIFKQNSNVIIGVRALRVPGQLQSLPSSEMRVKIAFQFFYLTPDALDFNRGFPSGSGESAQFCHVALKGIDLRLALAGNCIFVCNRGSIQFIARLQRFGRGKLPGIGLEFARFRELASTSQPFPGFSPLAHCTTATESVPQISRTRSNNSRSAWTALPVSIVASVPSEFTKSNATRQRPGLLEKSSFNDSSALGSTDPRSTRTRSRLGARSVIWSRRRASETIRRVPTSSIATRPLASKGVLVFRIISSF